MPYSLVCRNRFLAKFPESRFLAKKSDRADFDEFTANFAATKADREEVYSREVLDGALGAKTDLSEASHPQPALASRDHSFWTW